MLKGILLNFRLLYDLAAMSYNVYNSISKIQLNACTSEWIDIPNTQVRDLSVANDSLRMYLFSNNNSHTVAIKGTTMFWGLAQNASFDQHTYSSAHNDKYNDNLFYSCCYYKKSSIFEDCKKCETSTDSTDTCCIDCYKDTLDFELNYFRIAVGIIENLKKELDFDNSDIIFTGHSLGGTIASYLGLYYNKTAVGFESPGDKHYANLVGFNEKRDNIYHYGHDADPLFLGDCGSLCTSLGYHVDTKCHVGNTCLYKAKEKLGNTESILNHRIDYIIKHIIPHWENDLPECIQEECSEC